MLTEDSKGWFPPHASPKHTGSLFLCKKVMLPKAIETFLLVFVAFVLLHIVLFKNALQGF